MTKIEKEPKVETGDESKKTVAEDGGKREGIGAFLLKEALLNNDTGKIRTEYQKTLDLISDDSSGKIQGDRGHVLTRMFIKIKESGIKPSFEQAQTILKLLNARVAGNISPSFSLLDKKVAQEQLNDFEHMMKDPEQVKTDEEKLIRDFSSNLGTDDWNVTADIIAKNRTISNETISKIAYAIANIIKQNPTSHGLEVFINDLDNRHPLITYLKSNDVKEKIKLALIESLQTQNILRFDARLGIIRVFNEKLGYNFPKIDDWKGKIEDYIEKLKSE